MREVNDHLPNDIVDPEQIEDIVNMINDMGITVYEKAPMPIAAAVRQRVIDDEAAPKKPRPRSPVWTRIRPHDRPGAHVHA